MRNTLDVQQKRNISAIYSGIAGGFFYLFLNIVINPVFGKSKDVFHRIARALGSSQSLVRNHSLLLPLAVFLLFFIFSVGYAILFSYLSRREEIIDAAIIYILGGMGLYLLRALFQAPGMGLEGFLANTWKLIPVNVLYSLSVLWQFSWIRRRLEV